MEKINGYLLELQPSRGTLLGRNQRNSLYV